MSTYSSNLKIELIGTGEQAGTWGTTTNNNFSNVFEQAITGRVTVNFPSDANVTLTATDTVNTQDYRNLYLNLTSSGSLTVTRDLIVPTLNKTYIVQNNTTGGQSIRVIMASGTAVTIPNGRTATVYSNGTNVIQGYDYLPNLYAATLYMSGLTSGRVTYAGSAGVLQDSSSLTFNGSTLSSPQFTSTVSTGTAPMVVSSTTKVTNLNADLLDGLTSDAFDPAGTAVALAIALG
jgi:hypothetical protein